MKNSLRKRILHGQNIVGTMVRDFTSPYLISILEESGFDFVVVDCEHGPSDLKEIQNLVIAAHRSEISIIVRPPSISYQNIARYLDMGVDGLMIPHVDTLDQAKFVINCAKFSPIGERGYGMRQNLSKFYPCKDKADYIKKANESIVIFIQVESIESVINIENIIGLDYIDGVIMGPTDMTLDMGIIGQYNSEDFDKEAKKVLDACSKCNKGFGIHLGDIDLVQKWEKIGMNILMCGSISSFIKLKATEVYRALKNSFKEKHPNNRGDLY